MRTIDADKLKVIISEEVTRKFVRWDKTITVAEWETFIQDIIDNAPTVDNPYQEGHIDGMLQAEKLYARPQGEWIMNKTSVRGRNYTCTACEKVSRNKFHFCPNCGAQMKTRTDAD